MTKREITLYTDGACSGNPGVGGWAAVLIYKQHKKEISGAEAETTNNRMELRAIIEGLKAIKDASNDDYRRGRLTNHKVYGEANAVLAGDALLTAAFGFISKAPFDADTRIRAVEVLSECAGELGMVGGQVLDMQSESRQCTEQEVLDVQSRKTGALIRSACKLGVLAGNGSVKQLEAASEFANHLGLAFQIRDDILDVIGNAADLGKATGVDGNKNTFVHLYGIDKCNDLVQMHTSTAISALDQFNDADFMRTLANKLTARNA